MQTSIVSSGRLTPQEVLDDVAVVVLLDASSSMDDVETATREAANGFIGELQSGTPVTFSLATLASTVRWVIREKPVDCVQPLTVAHYVASGQTALYDAVGQAIERIEAMAVAPIHPVVAVFTDGDDNYSRHYDAPTLKPMIAERRARGWRFIAFVVGPHAQAATENAGFLPADIAPYAGDGTSTKAAFKRLAASVKRLTTAVETKALLPAQFL